MSCMIRIYILFCEVKEGSMEKSLSKMKRGGPRVLPCGTPLEMEEGWERPNCQRVLNLAYGRILSKEENKIAKER